MAELNDRLVGEVGVESFYGWILGDRLKGTKGTRLEALCPFHDDHDPSLSIDAEAGLWTCRTGCGGGDMVAFYAKFYGLDLSGNFKGVAQSIEEALLGGKRSPARPGIHRPPPKPQEDKSAIYGDLWEEYSAAQLKGGEPAPDFPEEYGVRLVNSGLPTAGLLLPVHLPETGRLVSTKIRYLERYCRFCKGTAEASCEDHVGRDGQVGGFVDKSLSTKPICLFCSKGSGAYFTAKSHCFSDHRGDVVHFPAGLMGWNLLRAYPEATVVVAEGEKDMLALGSLVNLKMFIVVSGSGGASTIPQGIETALRGRRVFLLFDADHAGAIGSGKWSRLLFGVASSVSRCRLREAPWGAAPADPRKDVEDFLSAAGTNPSDRANELLRWAEKWPVETDLEKPVKTARPPRPPAKPSGRKIKEGGRKTHLFSVAKYLSRLGEDPDSVRAGVAAENQACCDPPLSDEALEGIVLAGVRYEPADDADRQRLPDAKDPSGLAGIEQQPSAAGMTATEIEGNGHSPAKTLDGGGRDEDGTFHCERRNDDRPVIHVTANLDLVATAATQCLLDAKVEVYTRSRLLVRVLRAKRSLVQGVGRVQDAPVILEVSSGKLLDYIIQTARWEKSIKVNGEFEWIHTTPPPRVVEILEGRNEWPFDEIQGISETPFMRPDGSVCDKPGYDKATGILYEPNAPFDEVPENPTADDAAKALSLLTKPFDEFPWAGKYDQPAALAALLTLVARPAIEGPIPAFTISAPAAGTGKSLLANLICTLIHGHRPAMMTWIKDDEEFKKTLVSIGIAGDPAILIDNVDAVVESDFFAAILTGLKWEARLLGKNNTVPVPLQMVWFLTGNNLSTKGDLFRRQVPIYLDSHNEHPEERKINHPFILHEVLEQRCHLVPAALTVLRAHFLAGRPRTVPSELFGSYEAWDQVVRSAVYWLHGTDPCGNRPKAKDEGDPELGDLATLLSAWNNSVLTGEPRTCAQLIRMSEAPENADLKDALGVLNTKGDGRLPSPRVVGWFFRKHNGKIIKGLRLTHHGEDRNGVIMWVVEKS